MKFDQAELETRKAFLKLDSDDAQLLREVRDLLHDRFDDFVDAFYEHLLSFDETKALIADESLLTSVKEKQIVYMEQLLAGVYDTAYAKNRKQVGRALHRIGLHPKWLVGAYGNYLSWLMSETWKELGEDSEKLVTICQSVMKVALLDIGLAVDSYFAAKQEKLNLFSQVFKLNIEASLITDNEGIILHANDKVSEISGFSREELIGHSIKRLDSEENTEISKEMFSSLGKTGTWQGELVYRRKSSDDFPVWVTISCVKDDEGNITHYLNEFSDITDFRDAQNELAQRTEELARSNSELEQFAYVASHDLQEPLRMVASYTQLLARRYEGKLDEDADEFIHYAVDGATRMQGLIGDLLTYSRVGTRGKTFEPTDMNEIVDSVARNLSMAIEENGAELTHDPLPTVMADDSQMVQLFQNLIGNAIKFRRDEPPKVHLSAQPQRRRVALRGAGQRDWHRRGIFGKDFHHLSAPARQGRFPWNRDRARYLQKDRGASRRTDMDRGQSKSRNGVPFHDSGLNKGKQMMAPMKAGQLAEILLVEDNPGDVRLTQETLKECKLMNELHVAQDGIEAMAFLRRQGKFTDAPRPDVILLDLNLLKKDGREVLAEIKTDPDLKRIPVVIITSSEAEQDIIKTYELHVNCYVTKPVDLDQFVHMVRSIKDFWLTIAKLPNNRGS